MTNEVPRKALIAITSVHIPFYPDGSKTGLFYTEALHPYEVLTEAGFEVDLASETGTFGIDPHSITETYISAQDRKKILENPEHPFTVKLNKLHKAADLDPKQYGLFFASAGHGTLYDYPTASALKNIAADIYKRGGIGSAVCHGPAILPFILQENGKSIIEGKNVTGFTTEGEIVLNVLEKIKSDNVATIEEGAAKVGAKYVSPQTPFEDFSLTDGRIVTGANPASAKSTAEKAVQAFNSLRK